MLAREEAAAGRFVEAAVPHVRYDVEAPLYTYTVRREDAVYRAPLLRAIPHVRYDKVWVQTNAVVTCAFESQMGRQNETGVYKTQGDTNMTCCQMLGSPLEMDIVSISVRPAGFTEEYCRAWQDFLSQSVTLMFILGQDVVWFSCPLSIMRINPQDTQLFQRLAEQEREIFRIVERTQPLAREARLSAGTQRPLHLTSNEAFRAELRSYRPFPILNGFPQGFPVYVCLEGTLYRPVQ